MGIASIGVARSHQRRWEHTIRDDEDLRCHVDYIHCNSVKHAYALSGLDSVVSRHGQEMRVEMIVKDIRYESSFTATDERGLAHQLDVYVEIIDAGSFADPDAELRGLQRIQTAEGLHVNRVEKGVYKIVSSGETLTSDDSDAV